MIEIVAPFSNKNIWREHRYAPNGFATSDRFSEWILRMGLYHGGLWFDNTEKSTSEYGVLIFEKLSDATLFKMEIW